MMGRNQTMQTYSPRPRDIERRWYVVDADGAVLGRLASEVAKILRGKHKPIFAPHMDTGDHVIVINARGIRLTGGKEAEKIAYRHSGYPGGIKGIEYVRLLAERPAAVVEKAIRGMLPKNRLGRAMVHKLAVYEGPEHPHQAQKPVTLGLGEIPKWDGLPKPAAPKPPQTAAKKVERASQAKRPGARRPAAGSRRRGAGSAGGPARAASPRRRTPAASGGSEEGRRKGRGSSAAAAQASAPKAARGRSGSEAAPAKADAEKPKRTSRRPRRKKEQ